MWSLHHSHSQIALSFLLTISAARRCWHLIGVPPTCNVHTVKQVFATQDHSNRRQANQFKTLQNNKTHADSFGKTDKFHRKTDSTHLSHHVGWRENRRLHENGEAGRGNIRSCLQSATQDDRWNSCVEEDSSGMRRRGMPVHSGAGDLVVEGTQDASVYCTTAWRHPSGMTDLHFIYFSLII